MYTYHAGTGYQEYIPKMEQETKSKVAAKPDLWKQMRTIEKQSFVVSPNPGSSICTITTQVVDANTPAQLMVVDVLGKTILSKPIVQIYDTTLLPVSDIAGGVYLCTVSQNGRSILSTKIVVTH